MVLYKHNLLCMPCFIACSDTQRYGAYNAYLYDINGIYAFLKIRG